MDQSLINSNQCRHYDYQICDDSTDSHRKFGIELENDYFIPMPMNGTTCGFLSRCPTNEELENCITFTLSDESHWDPANVIFEPNRINLTINSVDRRCDFDPIVIVTMSLTGLCFNWNQVYLRISL